MPSASMPAMLMAGSVGMSMLQGGMNADNARTNAEANAGYIQAEINQEQVQSARDQTDLTAKTNAAQGRARAIIAAGGGDASGGSALALLESNDAASAITSSRMKTDSASRQSSLQARLFNTLMLGDKQATSAIIGGVGSSINTVGTYSLLQSAPKLSAGQTGLNA